MDRESLILSYISSFIDKSTEFSEKHMEQWVTRLKIKATQGNICGFKFKKFVFLNRQ